MFTPRPIQRMAMSRGDTLLLGIFVMSCLTNIEPVLCGCTGSFDGQICKLCVCDWNERRMNCSSRSLHKVPKVLPSGLTALELQRNSISRIYNFDFLACSDLQILRLDENRISDIDSNAFKHSIKLRTLRLNGNKINVSNEDCLPNDVLYHLTFLEVLRIEHNIYDWMTSYREGILRQKSQLVKLSLDAVEGVSFPKSFSTLQSLQSLSLYGNITTLRNETFSSMIGTQIENIYIASRRLRHIDPRALEVFTGLKLLDLSMNKELDVSQRHMWDSLKFTQLNVLMLNGILPVGINRLSEEFLPNVSLTPNLTELQLNDNHFQNISADWASKVPQLQKLSLKYNRFDPTSSYFMEALRPLRDLLYLNVDDQMMFHSKAYTAMFSNTLEPYINFTLPPRLQYFLWSNGFAGRYSLLVNRIIFNLESQNMKIIDLSQNFFSEVRGPIEFRNNQTLHIFNMSYCNVNKFSSHVFGPHSGVSIHILDLKHNMLGWQLNRDRNGSFMHQFQFVQIKVLNISENNIKFLYPDTFVHIKSLEVLVLSNNALHVWDSSLGTNRQLRYLDLSSNSLTYISHQQLQLFLKVTAANLSIDVSDNPFSYVCISLAFFKLLQHPEEKLTFVNINHLHLYSRRGMLNISDLPSLINHLEMVCSAKAWVVGTSVTVSLMLLLVFLSIVVYRHRWDIRYLILRMKRSRKHYQPLDNDDLVYDAFVAYDLGDLDWVKYQLMIKLEPLFKLCIPSRDWLPGPTIEENVCVSIQNSRKTILVISSNFIQNNWCEFEMQMARRRGFDLGQELVVVVALEEVPLSDMSPTLANLRRTITWLEWPGSQDSAEFWQHLKFAVSRSGYRPSRCGCGRSFYPDGTVV